MARSQHAAVELHPIPVPKVMSVAKNATGVTFGVGRAGRFVPKVMGVAKNATGVTFGGRRGRRARRAPVAPVGKAGLADLTAAPRQGSATAGVGASQPKPT